MSNKMFKRLFQKHFKNELNIHFNKLHLDLSKAFLNIKDDITNIHKHLGEKNSKIYDLERRLLTLEHKLTFMIEGEKRPRLKESKENYEREKPDSDETIESEFPTLTYTQKVILAAIYELGQQLNSPVSFKSLATFLYPDKKYASVRTTLSEYIDLLSTYDLAKKEKIGRETVTIITKKGKKLAKEVVNDRRAKKKLISEK